MKIQGKKLEKTNVVNIVLPRNDGDIVLRAGGIKSFEEFLKVCPQPKPPMIKKPDGTTLADTKNPEHGKAMIKWASLKSSWMVIKSLSITPGLEWETVDLEDPNTWENYMKELETSGFTEYELGRIMEGVTEANGINQRAIDEAEKHFLAGLGQEQ